MSPIITRPALGCLREYSKGGPRAGAAILPSIGDQAPTAIHLLCGRSADRIFSSRRSDGGLIAQAAHASGAGGIGLDRARKHPGAASKSAKSAIFKQSLRLPPDDAPNLYMPLPLSSQPLSPSRILPT